MSTFLKVIGVVTAAIAGGLTIKEFVRIVINDKNLANTVKWPVAITASMMAVFRLDVGANRTPLR